MKRSEGVKKVLIACGGTGGHLFPGIAVAQELKNRGHEVTLVISKKAIDAQASEKYRELNFLEVDAIAKPATFSIGMLGFLWKLLKAVLVARNVLKQGQYDTVLGMGGFTSFAPVCAAKQLGIKTLIHDSNAFPGRANIMTSKFANQILLGTSAASRFFKGKETLEVGTPVREEIQESQRREDVAKIWGLDLAKKTVLIVGGSQGAQGLNTLCVEGLSLLLNENENIQVLHIAGPRDEERVKGLLADDVVGYHVIGFCAQMPEALALADFVIARSGASTLSELAYLGKPSLLVPFPYAADDHQTYNAQVFVDAGAATLQQEKELDSTRLKALVGEALNSPEELKRLSEAAFGIAKPDSAVLIADAILS